MRKSSETENYKGMISNVTSCLTKKAPPIYLLPPWCKESGRRTTATILFKEAIIVSGLSESERVSDAQTLGAGPNIIEKLGLVLRKILDRST